MAFFRPMKRLKTAKKGDLWGRTVLRVGERGCGWQKGWK